jgi:anaerobic selenocysteine-containing dehydrogenase
LQYQPAVVAPVAERRSDTWMIFELAKRLDMGREFFDGDIEAAYAHELAPAGLTLEQLKASPGGITVHVTPRYRKTRRPTNGALRAALTRRTNE